MKKIKYISPEIEVHVICTSNFIATSYPRFSDDSAVKLGIGDPSDPNDALGREFDFDDEEEDY